MWTGQSHQSRSAVCKPYLHAKLRNYSGYDDSCRHCVFFAMVSFPARRPLSLVRVVYRLGAGPESRRTYFSSTTFFMLKYNRWRGTENYSLKRRVYSVMAYVYRVDTSTVFQEENQTALGRNVHSNAVPKYPHQHASVHSTLVMSF